MKRFHVHLHVQALDQSIAFCSRLFAAAPVRVERDYAKWMLDDPRLDFAISTRGAASGVDHLGFQVNEASELGELKARAQAADMALLDEGATTCCYARSEKHWVTDPQGIALEHFYTLGKIPVFREADAASDACCAAASTASGAPAASAASAAATVPANEMPRCCAPTAGARAACC
ncbi:ArsI/CadI family heavy metal resistance metalloenzyme [Tepidimonas sp.]|uniref:ArsI/CadI family heavy metal resistance metalloenzyme n=1 Tax=Tepidimonas sp. TaxID=2002775 RepID=UPI002FDFC72C